MTVAPTSRARRGAVTRAGGLLSTGVLLAGCAPTPVPQAQVETAAPRPVVTPEQATRISQAAVEAVADADAAADPALLTERVAGPELALRSARYAAARAGAPAGPAYGADVLEPLSAFVPRQEGWPRWLITVTQPGPDRLPSLALLRSESAREPYRLWASPSLLSGVSLQPAGSPAAGVEAVDPEGAAGLAAAPSEVAQRYADVLLRGPDSLHAAEFAEDSYRSEVAVVTRADAEAVRAAGGTYAQERALVPGSVVAARTDDGGALVMAAYDWSVTHSLPPEAGTGRLAPVFAALAGREAVRGATRRWVEVMAFAVPPAGSGPVRVVAAQHGPVAVEAT
ncbi:hypothetical protein CLV92_101341 [Kineococcus xinjiangensis]|uniref:DUF8094 domain-containing protein n=1 Tax=Kineococcus xinjiangensis TaxID=512762 RepID=A0A2S6IWA8_9ACTN|nr:hypothetical protein [Kineococcus xinjiangensis]PPK98642.1 hypothetical protein CLV92_101341 [Kineococcus xinjiangensis]